MIDCDVYLLMLLLILVELLGFEFLSRLLFCFFISLFLLSELFLESPLLSVLKELERFVLQMNERFCFKRRKKQIKKLHLPVDAVCDAEGGWRILTAGALEGT